MKLSRLHFPRINAQACARVGASDVLARARGQHAAVTEMQGGARRIKKQIVWENLLNPYLHG